MEPLSSQPITTNPSGIASPPQLQQVQPLAKLEDQGGMNPRRIVAILQRRFLVIVGIATVAMSFAISSTLSKSAEYQSQFQLLVGPVDASSASDDLSGLTGSQSGGSSSNQTDLDYDTQIQVLKSPELIGEAVNQLQKTYPDLSYDAIVGNLSITRLGKTKVLQISYQGSDPTEIQAVVEKLSQVYLKYSLQKRQTNLREGLQFVEKQLPPLQRRFKTLQDQLQRFRQLNGFIDPSNKTDQVTSQIRDLEQQQLALSQNLAQARYRFNLLQGETGAVAALENAPVYQEIIGQLRQIEVKKATELGRFQAQNPTIQLLNQQQANLMPLLRQEAERVVGAKLATAASEIQLLEIQNQAIDQAKQQLNLQAETLPVLTRQYADLQGELQAANESLNRFLNVRETLQIKASQQEIPWQVIQASKQASLISPNVPKELMTGVLISLALGIGAAFLLEKLNNVYYTVDELKAKVKLPLLGIIPFQRESLGKTDENYAKKFVPAKIPNRLIRNIPGLTSILNPQAAQQGYYGQGFSNFQEALRVLYTNIQQLNSSHLVRSLVISSALPGDGKTTIALNLAQAAAAIGQRVLLVDADLRNPQIHVRWGLPNQTGLTELMSDNIPVKGLFQRPFPNLKLGVLTAGQIPDDPIKLLSSRKMHQFMEKCHQSFDLVIYDVPPLTSLADASLLAAHTDGLVLIVRLGQTDGSALTQAIDRLKLSQTRVLGYVING